MASSFAFRTPSEKGCFIAFEETPWHVHDVRILAGQSGTCVEIHPDDLLPLVASKVASLSWSNGGMESSQIDALFTLNTTMNSRISIKVKRFGSQGQVGRSDYVPVA